MVTESMVGLFERIRDARERLEQVADRAATFRARLEVEAPSIAALDRLASQPFVPTLRRGQAELWDGEEADLPSGAWELSLISDEGK